MTRNSENRGEEGKEAGAAGGAVWRESCHSDIGGGLSWRVTKPACVAQWSESMPLLDRYDSYDSFVTALSLTCHSPFSGPLHCHLGGSPYCPFSNDSMAASKAKVDSKFQSKAKQSRWFWLTLDFIQFQSKAKQRATKSKGISKVPKWGLRERRPRLHPLVGRSPHGT